MFRRERAQIRTGMMGSGKSYTALLGLLEWLQDTPGRVHSNLPLNVDAIAEYCSEEWGADPESIRERVVLIPSETVARWKDFDYGAAPWVYFSERGPLEPRTPDVGLIEGDLIILDECHEFAGDRGLPAAWRREWAKWIGYIRHEKAYVEFISQTRGGLADEVQQRIGAEVVHTNVESYPSIFGIPLGDLLELEAKWRGHYRAGCRQQLRQKHDKTFKVLDASMVVFSKRVFALYDSHSAPDEGREKHNASAEERIWERKSWRELLWWFVKRNAIRLGVGLGKLLFILGFLLFLLTQNWFSWFTWLFSGAMKAEKPPEREPPKAALAAPTDERLPGDVLELRALLRDRNDTIEQLVIEKRAADEARKRAAENETKLRERIERDSIVTLITDGECVLRDGRVLAVGDEFLEGPHAGTRVSEVDTIRRRVVLSDGTILRCGRDRAEDVETDTDRGSEEVVDAIAD